MFTFPTDTNCSVCSYWKDWSFESLDFKSSITDTIYALHVKLLKIAHNLSGLVVVYNF